MVCDSMCAIDPSLCCRHRESNFDRMVRYAAVLAPMYAEGSEVRWTLEQVSRLRARQQEDGDADRLDDLPAMTDLANLIRRSAWHALRSCDARFREGIDADRAAGLIAVSVTMNNKFPDAIREVLAEVDSARASLSSPPTTEETSR
jgi:hypothetical protein